MKVIKPFFLWALVGSALSLSLIVSAYFSPLREAAYFRADPEMASIRSKLDKYQEWLSHTDLRLAAAGEENQDSLRTAQTKAWRDYKGWRTRLGELARAHMEPTAAGFWPWMHSLRFWILPFFALMALVPGGFAAWRAYSAFRPGRARFGKAKSGQPRAGSNAARAQALSSFEEAIQKVARISKADQRSDRPVDPPATRTHLSSPADKDPEPEYLKAEAPIPEPDDSRADSRSARIPSTWGESLDLTRASAPSEDVPPASLSMEDEDAGDASVESDGGSGTLGVMPPTTEVERVERRKDEVLKLARKGMTSSEISRRLRISQDQVEFIIRLRREKG